jgi:signal peptidase II
MASKKPASTAKSTPQRATTPSSGRSALGLWLGLAAIVLLLDQLSKITIIKTFQYQQSISITSFFNLVYARNEGAAFSFLANQSGWQRYFFTAIGVVAAVFIIYLLSKHAGQKLYSLALALILGGAIGNVIDRVMYGYVVDFLDFYWRNYHFPAFNVADSAICLGAALFILDELRRSNR